MPSPQGGLHQARLLLIVMCSNSRYLPPLCNFPLDFKCPEGTSCVCLAQCCISGTWYTVWHIVGAQCIYFWTYKRESENLDFCPGTSTNRLCPVGQVVKPPSVAICTRVRVQGAYRAGESMKAQEGTE